MQEFTTYDGKKIHVYDDLLSFHDRDRFQRFIEDSWFKINGSDLPGDPTSLQIYSSYNEFDLTNMGFRETEAYKMLDEKYNLSDRNISQIRVNCSLHSERNLAHTDDFGLTLLYYSNMKWEMAWGGHIFFVTSNLEEIDKCVSYRPGRIIIFDGTIPHIISTPTIAAESPRFSFAIKYSGDPL